MNTQDMQDMLLKNSIKPSHHRLRIYSYLLEKRNHPNVEMIYEELHQDIPTLSRTTLYNTLDLFQSKGIVSLLTIDEKEMRYDADISAHGHFQCRSCGMIKDIFYDQELELPRELAGYIVDEQQSYYKGICPACYDKPE